ncbi:MAG TPA: ABC transporter permease subunit, partial [Metabacillus sp.]|nr:ABC transporter permease subunit [Metabacillus sp.]
MVAKELIKIEIRKHWSQLLVLVLLIGMLPPIQLWIHYLAMKDHVMHGYEVDIGTLDIAFILNVLVITLAIVQIGIERSNGTMEFNLSLPFSKGSIFISKWFVGTWSILLSWGFAFSLSAIIVQLIDMPVINLNEYFGFLLGSLLMFYSLTFSAGAITGTPSAQGLVTFTISILPLLVFALLTAQIQIFFMRNFQLSDVILEGIFQINPLSYISFRFGGFPIKELYIPFILAGLFLMIGFYSFQRHPFERNGSFFVWRWMERPVQIIVIFLGILGFSTFGYLSTTQENLLGYFIGAAIGA